MSTRVESNLGLGSTAEDVGDSKGRCLSALYDVQMMGAVLEPGEVAALLGQAVFHKCAGRRQECWIALSEFPDTVRKVAEAVSILSLIHISEPTRQEAISYFWVQMSFRRISCIAGLVVRFCMSTLTSTAT